MIYLQYSLLYISIKAFIESLSETVSLDTELMDPLF